MVATAVRIFLRSQTLALLQKGKMYTRVHSSEHRQPEYTLQNTARVHASEHHQGTRFRIPLGYTLQNTTRDASEHHQGTRVRIPPGYTLQNTIRVHASEHRQGTCTLQNTTRIHASEHHKGTPFRTQAWGVAPMPSPCFLKYLFYDMKSATTPSLPSLYYPFFY